MTMAAVVAVLSLAPPGHPNAAAALGTPLVHPNAAAALGTPLAAAGQAATKTWNPPRTPDGKPDLQGIWGPEIGGTYSIEDLDFQDSFQAEIQGTLPDPRRKGKSRIVDPADGKIPYQPWAAAKQREIFEHHTSPNAEQIDPQARCLLSGVPRVMYLPNRFRILQAQGHVVILYEHNHTHREIPMDGRPHLDDKIRLWMGDSRGRWEGDTLVVETSHFNGKLWFDIVGNFQSDALRVVERFTVVDPDQIHYEATIEDPKLYTKHWKLVVPLLRVKEPGYELFEFACHEGNRAPELMLAR